MEREVREKSQRHTEDRGSGTWALFVCCVMSRNARVYTRV